VARAKSQISVLDLLEIYREPEPLMAIFQAFFDESGKFKDKRVVSFCGFCSPLARVREFEEDWKGVLRHYQLPCLTMKRALRRKIPFSRTTKAESVEERNAVLLQFVNCIRKHFELGTAIVVDVDAYNKWPYQDKKKIGGSDDPHYFTFLNGVLSPSKFVRPDDRVSLICDDDQQTALNCYRLYSRIRTINPDLRRKLVSIAFADDEEFVPLQAADLFASLCRLEAGREFHREYYEYMPTYEALIAPGSGLRWCVQFNGTSRFAKLSKDFARART
jgi:Protein of unknown function (DUF3800)